MADKSAVQRFARGVIGRGPAPDDSDDGVEDDSQGGDEHPNAPYHRIEVEPAANGGSIVHVHSKDKKGDGKDGYTPTHRDSHAFANKATAAKFVAGAMDHLRPEETN